MEKKLGVLLMGSAVGKAYVFCPERSPFVDGKGDLFNLGEKSSKEKHPNLWDACVHGFIEWEPTWFFSERELKQFTRYIGPVLKP